MLSLGDKGQVCINEPLEGAIYNKGGCYEHIHGTLAVEGEASFVFRRKSFTSELSYK